MSLNMKPRNPNLSNVDSKIKVIVTWAGHNDTIGDAQEEGVYDSLMPGLGRNYLLSGFSLSPTQAGVIPNIVVPQEVLGSFKLPQVGDVIWVEKSRRVNTDNATYIFSSYSSTERYGTLPPQWGSMSGDYGHLRSYKDHNTQFLPTTEGSDFVTKYIRSVTGYRFRKYYKNTLAENRFALRGDPVFDIDPDSINNPYLINDGSHLISGGNLESDKGKIPEPLNTPKEREKDEKYSYLGVVYEPLEEGLSPDVYNNSSRTSKKGVRVIKSVLKNKNYLSYQPVMDKEYLDRVNFEREIPAAEEYQVALRGNNKLLIQDHHGDGEQLVITLKSQYDEQFTIVHNGDRGQVRVRDHMGQGVLLDADPEAPRVISWTANKQVIEQGAVSGLGEFTYIRNGSAFGDSQTSYGTKTGLTKNDVPNQEFLMVSTPDIIGELASRLSAGMNTLAASKGSPGIYIRNNIDPNLTSQEWAMYQMDTEFAVMTKQENLGHEGAVQKTEIEQKLDGTSATQRLVLEHESPGVSHSYTETTTASDSLVSKDYALSRNGGAAELTHSETITDDTTVNATRVLRNSLSDQVTYTESAAGSPAVTYELLNKGAKVVEMSMDTGKISTKKIDNGAEINEVIQENGALHIRRLALGLGTPINIGMDGGSGTITIGNALGDLKLEGKNITSIADKKMAISGKTGTSITDTESVAIQAPAVSIDP